MSVGGGIIWQDKTSSSLISEIVNKTTTEILMENLVSNLQDNNANNIINVSGIKSVPGCKLKLAFNQSIIQKPELSSITQIKQDSSLDNKLKDAIISEIQNTSTGIQFMTSPTNTTSVNKNITEIASAVKKSNVVQCVQRNTATNQQTINNVESSCSVICQNVRPSDFNKDFTPAMLDELCSIPIGGSQDLLQAAVGKCLTENEQVVKKIDELARTLTGGTKGGTTGIEIDKVVDSIGGAVSGALTAGMLPLIILAVGVVLLILYLVIA